MSSDNPLGGPTLPSDEAIVRHAAPGNYRVGVATHVAKVTDERGEIFRPNNLAVAFPDTPRQLVSPHSQMVWSAPGSEVRVVSMRSAKLLRNRSGQSIAEFAVLLVLVLSALALILMNFRSHVQHIYGGTADAIAHADCSSGGGCPGAGSGGTAAGTSGGGTGGSSGSGPTWSGAGTPPPDAGGSSGGGSSSTSGGGGSSPAPGTHPDSSGKH
jgi:hypothetical protein